MGSYKIVRIAGMHSEAAMDLLYRKNSQLSLAPYILQQQFIFENAYMYSDTFSKEMRKLGHWAEEIVYDVKPLQMMWMREKGLKIDSKNWQSQVILAQLDFFRPDIVFFQDIHSLSFDLRVTLKERIPSIKKIIIFRGFPGVDSKLFKELSVADLLLVGSPILVDKCREQGLKPHLMYHYFDSSIIERLKKISSGSTKGLIDFSFVGSSGYGYEAHRDRYHMLSNLLNKTPIQLWVDEPKEKLKVRRFVSKGIKFFLNFYSLQSLETLKKCPVFPGKIKKIIDGLIDQKLSKNEENRLPPVLKPLRKLFPKQCNPPLFGLEMFEMLQRSKIVLNRHSTPAQGTVDNIRMFQATGVGACLLTDTGRNMRELFEPDREVVTYSNFEECLEKYLYLMNNQKKMFEIAAAGQKRTLKDHTATRRFGQINCLIEELFRT